jgi:hypothetical protein
VVASVVPSGRSVQVGDTATAFATIINLGPGTATACGIALPTGLPADFLFQTTDPATNALSGTPDTPVDIAAGAAQSFVFAITPTAPISPTDIQLVFDCTNTNPANILPGLNTLVLSASNTPTPDIVALAATLSNDGIVEVSGTGVFAVATVNLGASGTIIVSADTGNAVLPVSISVCETNPISSICLADPVSAAGSLTTQIDSGETSTFGFFVAASGNVPFDPAANRIFVRFKDSGGAVRGATSVAVRTTDLNITGNYSFIETVTSSTCPGTVPGQQDIFSVAASQSGQNLTLIEDHGTVLTGTLIGTSIAVQGTLFTPVPGTSCVITDNISFNATVNPTTLDLSGTATEFFFSNAPSLCGGFASCTDNTAVVATRLSPESKPKPKSMPWLMLLLDD